MELSMFDGQWRSHVSLPTPDKDVFDTSRGVAHVEPDLLSLYRDWGWDLLKHMKEEWKEKGTFKNF